MDGLQTRIRKLVTLKKNKLSRRVQRAILKEVREDLILPLLGLTPAARVKFVIDKKFGDATLTIGPAIFNSIEKQENVSEQVHVSFNRRTF